MASKNQSDVFHNLIFRMKYTKNSPISKTGIILTGFQIFIYLNHRFLRH